MGISEAVSEFADIIAGIEQTGTDVRSVSITDSETTDLVGRIDVSTPVINGLEFDDGVSVAAPNASLTDGKMEVTLEFTLSQSNDASSRSESVQSTSGSTRDESATATPSYKDPDALRAVYEEHDSFPAMTEALDADVTSETVRRHMVKHGIHDPSASTDVARTIDTSESTASTPETTATEDSSAEPSTSSTAESSDERSVAALLTKTDHDEDDPLIADGSGVPQTLTIRELTTILDRSRTVFEVSRTLELGHEQTRRLLNELGVIGFVSGRLTDRRDEVTLSLVEQRLQESGFALE